MKNFTKKQHWIPRMHLKEWVNLNSELEYFSLKEVDFCVSKYNKNKKKFSNDKFYVEEMYEREGSLYNETENLLSWIEGEFEVIKRKIVKSSRNNRIELNRRDLEILKTYINTMGSRTKSIFERFKNLDGDLMFKNSMKNLTIEERYKILYDSIDDHILLQKKLIENGENVNKTKEILELEKKIENSPAGFMRLMRNTSIKIFSSTSSSFLLTDQFSTSIVNPIRPGGFLIGFAPITPKLCIGLLYENELIRMSRDEGLDFLEPGKRFISNYFDINYDKFFKFDAIRSYKSKYSYSYDDKFKYKNNFLSNEEVSIINAYLATQASDLLIFEKRNDLHDAFESEKKYGIYRGEDMFKDDKPEDINENIHMDIYGDKFDDTSIYLAVNKIKATLLKMITKNYLQFFKKFNDNFPHDELEIIRTIMHIDNYYVLQNHILSMMFPIDKLEEDSYGDLCLSDEMIIDPEVMVFHNFIKIWDIIVELSLEDKELKKFKNITSGSSEQGVLNGPDFIFEYEDYSLGIEITSNIIPIFTCKGNVEMNEDELNRIARKIISSNNIDPSFLEIEWRVNRFDESKMDLLIRKRYSEMQVESVIDSFENIIKAKIDKLDKYQKTDKLVIVIQASDFSISSLDEETEIFKIVEDELNKKYSDLLKISIL